MRENEVLLSIFVPTFNHEKYIEDCLKGIIKQKTNFKYQALIFDDCSTDNTREIIKKYQRKYPDIIKPILRNKNLGAMGNFVESLNEIHSEYVAFCDGDDYWTDPNKLQNQVDFLRKHPSYTICCHQTEIFFEDGSQQNQIFPKITKSCYSLNDLLNENIIVANSVVYRWKYTEKNSLKREFPKNIVPGDYYIHLMHAKNGKVHVIDKVMSRYRRQSQGMWYLSSQPDRQNEFFIKYGRKYLRFYKIITKKLGLRKNMMSEQQAWLIKGCLKAYYTEKHYLAFFAMVFREFWQNRRLFMNMIKRRIGSEK